MKRNHLLIAGVLLASLSLGTPAVSLAKTVYYKGTSVFWNYGRNAGVWGFSDCNSGRYEHRSSVNGYDSGWHAPGNLSKAHGWIGTATPQAYWDCRG